MNDPLHASSIERASSRRAWLRQGGLSAGAIALSTLLANERTANAQPAAKQGARTHHPPRAKRLIILNMSGAPSQLDLFDEKPELKKHEGLQPPANLIAGVRFAFIGPEAKLMASPWSFARYGQSGLPLSECAAPLGDVADDLLMVHGVSTDQFNHVPAALKLTTGFARAGRPSLGAWTVYGLGSEAENLPGFVVMNSGEGNRTTSDVSGAAFLPGRYQGVELLPGREPVLFLQDPPGVSRSMRAKTLQAIRTLDEEILAADADPATATRIEQYELAFRMQAAAPEAVDLTRESAATLAAYGVKPGERSFAANCLLARRLVERGVRVVQLNHGEWDMHGGTMVSLIKGLPEKCQESLPPIAALLKDLKTRGLLDDTLVVFAGEFGRTPMIQGEPGPDAGRDHHRTFTVWMAGAGVNAGYVHGRTDDLGFAAVEGGMDVHDLQATILHLFGLDHERLTYRVQGRDFRLTDVSGNVQRDLFA